MARRGISPPRAHSSATATSAQPTSATRAAARQRALGRSSRSSIAIYLAWTLIVYFLEPGLR